MSGKARIHPCIRDRETDRHQLWLVKEASRAHRLIEP